MGLDISVNRLRKRKGESEDSAYFRMVDRETEVNYDDNGFPSWTKEFESEKEDSFYEWDKFKEESGIDVMSLEWAGETYSKEGCFMHLIKDKGTPNEEHIEVDLDKVPTINKKITVIYYDEVGYQRKGLNAKFYEDYRNGKIGYFVWKKDELLRYKEDYCDTNEEKQDFQRNIIDKFIEERDCVTFDW